MDHARGLAAIVLAGLVAAIVTNTARADTYTIKMNSNSATGSHFFDPAKIEIHPGDKVIWVHDDTDNEHNVAAYPDRIPPGTKPFLSRMLTRPGDTWWHTFAIAGSYYYHCQPHESGGMLGLIIVGRQTSVEDLRQPRHGEMRHDQGGDSGPTNDGALLTGDHMMMDGSVMKDVEMTEGEVMKETDMMKPHENSQHAPPDDDGYYGEDHHFD